MRLHAKTHAQDEEQLRFRARMVVAGVAVTYLMALALGVWIATTWSGHHRGLISVLLVIATVAATGVLLLPYDRIVRSRYREPFFLAWSIADIALITGVAALDGGAGSPITLAYFLTLAFAALAYPLWSVVAISAVSVTCFAALSIFETGGPLQRPTSSYEWIFAVCLALTGVMCVWQSRLQASQQARLHSLARRDPLTGCLNRLGLGERFHRELLHLGNLIDSLGVIVIDLEGFKAVNDQHGHSVGDELLRWVVRAAEGVLRDGDVIGRLGGDEFAALVPGADRTTLHTVAGRLRSALAERIVATTGVALAPEDGLDSDTLLRVADLRLYALRRDRPGSRSPANSEANA